MPKQQKSEITAPLVEGFVLEGLSMWCRFFWGGLSVEMKSSYRHLAPGAKGTKREWLKDIEKTLIDQLDSDPVEEYKMGLAFETLTILGVDLKIKPQSVEHLFREISLMRCRMGAPGSIADIRFYLEKELNAQEKELETCIRLAKEFGKIPGGILEIIKHRILRIERMEKIKAPQNVIDYAYSLIGGAPLQKMTLNERSLWYHRYRISYEKREALKLRRLLEELAKGDFRNVQKRLLDLEDLCVNEDPNSTVDMPDLALVRQGKKERGEFRKGQLSVFYRQHPDGSLTLAREVIQWDYYLPKALLKAFQATSGTAGH